MNHKEITDHSLQLLVDNQFDIASRDKLLNQIEASPELQQKLKQLTELKELVGSAYIQEKPKRSATVNKTILGPKLFVAIAASLIMTFGITLGWFSHQQYESDRIVVAKIKTPVEKFTPEFSLAPSIQNNRRYMMHFDTLNETRLKNALLETNSIIESYAKSDLPVKIDLLFDQQSVHMFKPEYVSQINRLKSIIAKYKNIQLYACSKSIKLFLNPKEISNDISIFHSDQVVREMIPKRINQGWVYIKA